MDQPEFRVLGPVEACHRGRQIPVAGKSLILLAGLLLSANELVSADRMSEWVWPEDLPEHPRAALHNALSRLRHLLGTGVIETLPSGYRLAVRADQLDALAFGQLADRARHAVGAGNPAAACSLYEQALGLWRGEPAADVDVLRQHPAVTALRSRRAVVVADYADAACGAGWHDRPLPQLEALTEREPLDERAHARLMIALAGAGRQADALRVFEDLRRRLDDELGMYPGQELVDTHARVLRQDVPAATRPPGPGAARPARALRTAGRAASPVIPRQLPAASAFFAARQNELAVLNGLLGQPAAGRGAVVISAVGGTAGVGKTALAVHWAHQVADRFPDGQLYVNLRGFGPSGEPATPEEAIRGFLDALDVPPQRIPAGLGGQAALYRSVLAGQRMLIVLDNARDSDQVRPLLPASAGCMVVITSRSQLDGLVATQGASLLALNVLSTAGARELLVLRLGARRLAGEPEAAAELARQCAGLPLALSIAAARATAHPGFPLAAIADELRHGPGRLDALSSGDSAASVRMVFSWSYDKLSAGAARMFRLIGISPGPDITAAAAASLAGRPLPEVRQAIRELVGVGLVTEHAPGRYAAHDLLSAYAAERARAEDSDADRRAATGRILDHYLHTAHAATMALTPIRDPLSLAAPAPGAAPAGIADDAAAMAWFRAERLVLLRAIAEASETGFDVHAWQLPWTVETFLDLRGNYQDWAATQRIALGAARRLGDPAAQARAQLGLGSACLRLGHREEGCDRLQDAIGLYRQAGDASGEAMGHHQMARAREYQHRYTDALGHARQALELFRATGYRRAEASSLNTVGWCYAMLGNYPQTVAHCQQALELLRKHGDRHGEAHTWDSLGYAHQHLGNDTDADACYGHALRIYREVGDLYHQAETLSHLGEMHEAAGDPDAAGRAWQQAVVILDDLRHHDADEVRGKLRRLDPAVLPAVTTGRDGSLRAGAGG